MLRRRILVFILVSGLANAHASTGGTPANPDTFRYLVSMQGSRDPTQASSFCTGAQVNPETIITAGHCLDGTASTSPLYVSRKLGAGELQLSPVRWLSVHPRYGTKPPSFVVDPYDIATLKASPPYPDGNLDYKPGFDPHSYIEQQPRQELLVDDFGFDRANNGIYTGKTVVLSESKCVEQLDDLIQQELIHLSNEEAAMLLGLASQLGDNPRSLFCAFIKKTDNFQHGPGDSGAPLVFPVNGRATLAGVLGAIVPIPSSQQYSMIAIYNSIANGRDFLAQCMLPDARGTTRFATARKSLTDAEDCHYRHTRAGSISTWLALLLQ
jgi:hypothetical protein